MSSRDKWQQTVFRLAIGCIALFKQLVVTIYNLQAVTVSQRRLATSSNNGLSHVYVLGCYLFHKLLTPLSSEYSCKEGWCSLRDLCTDRTQKKKTLSTPIPVLYLIKRYLAKAVSLDPEFLLWANIPQRDK
jgi:hypothetical protein